MSQASNGDPESILNGSSMESLLPMMILGTMMNDPEMRQMVESNPGLALQVVSSPDFLRQILHDQLKRPL